MMRKRVKAKKKPIGGTKKVVRREIGPTSSTN